jgi:DNA-directed RNA polymerase subunit F
MKEIREILLGQKEKDDATLNYASREAQVAILNPDLSDSIKEEILNAAVGTINQIAERRWIYEAIPRKNADLRPSGTIYEAK